MLDMDYLPESNLLSLSYKKFFKMAGVVEMRR